MGGGGEEFGLLEGVLRGGFRVGEAVGGKVELEVESVAWCMAGQLSLIARNNGSPAKAKDPHSNESGTVMWLFV